MEGRATVHGGPIYAVISKALCKKYTPTDIPAIEHQPEMTGPAKRSVSAPKSIAVPKGKMTISNVFKISIGNLRPAWSAG